MLVVKVGGSQLEGQAQVRSLARALSALRGPVVIVHGGGSLLDDLQSKLGQPSRKIDGLRCTDEGTLASALMVLSGRVNKELVAGLMAAGVDAIGLCGVDGGLIRVRKLTIAELDLGFVGEVHSVRVELLQRLLASGLTPVVAPPSLGLDDHIYNVNADQIASALAVKLEARELAFVSNAAGVALNGGVVASLHASAVEGLIAEGQIRGGMIPKVRAALEALEGGVPGVRIVDRKGLQTGAGTRIVPGLEDES
jgi:acetylglutamate kinase